MYDDIKPDGLSHIGYAAGEFGDDDMGLDLGGLLGGVADAASGAAEANGGGGGGGADPLAGILSGLEKSVVAAGSHALQGAAKQGFAAGITALGKSGPVGNAAASVASGIAANLTNLHAHPVVQAARASLPSATQAVGFDAAMALGASHAKGARPPRPLPPVSHAAYMMQTGMAGHTAAATAAVANQLASTPAGHEGVAAAMNHGSLWQQILHFLHLA